MSSKLLWKLMGILSLLSRRKMIVAGSAVESGSLFFADPHQDHLKQRRSASKDSTSEETVLATIAAASLLVDQNARQWMKKQLLLPLPIAEAAVVPRSQ